MLPLEPKLEMDGPALRRALALALEFLGRKDIGAATVGEALERSGLGAEDQERVRIALTVSERLEERGRTAADVEMVTRWKDGDGRDAGLSIRWKPGAA
jgi:hypothetical protein